VVTLQGVEFVLDFALRVPTPAVAVTVKNDLASPGVALSVDGT
tara:strand:- start:287 stop:415 length:129 start_codon:yes stop_codon:yes gene_type:complete